VNINGNVHVAKKIIEEMMFAELMFTTKGVPHADTLYQRAKRYRGMTRRAIEKVAALGPDVPLWLDFFTMETTTEAP
jgi:hypothetical protein